MEKQVGKLNIKRKIIGFAIISFVILCITLFLPARTLNYWEAWVYIGIIFSCASGVIAYFLKHDPQLLERRLKTREKLREQKLIIRVAWLLFMPTFLIPGFDRYYGWSDVPLILIIFSDILVLTGYLIVITVFRENSYTSRVVDVESGQKVISTGPYAIVRHPMYSGNILMYCFTPIALGSYWGLIGSVLIFLLLILRIKSEERFLLENLNGYKEYLKRTRYRLIPGIW